MARVRKARNDRNQLIYCITNQETGEQYIGVTVATGGVKKALRVRMQKHIRRALTENRDWALCTSIREHGVEAFTYGLIEVIRGKLAVHRREFELIRQHNPALNTAK
jgi:hypothetical protein